MEIFIKTFAGSNIDIGIWKIGLAATENEILNTFFANKFRSSSNKTQPGYAYVINKGCLTVAHTSGVYGRDYGKKCIVGDKIDMILDKNSKSGYDSLSEEEKEYLFKQGRNR